MDGKESRWVEHSYELMSGSILNVSGPFKVINV